MRKNVLLIAAALAAVLSIGMAEAAGPRERAVSIVRGRVSPHALRIESGTTVTWRNLDTVVQSVVIDKLVDREGRTSDPGMRSPQLAKYDRGAPRSAAAFSQLFVDAGIYKYKLAGTSAAYTIVVDPPRGAVSAPTRTATAVPTAPAGSPTATATTRPATATPTARPPAPTRTPRPAAPTRTPAPIPTVAPWPPATLPANWQKGYCGGWQAVRTEATSVQLTGECIFPTSGYTVQMTPRQLQGSALLVDRRMIPPAADAVVLNVIEVVPVSVHVAAGAERREVVVMPDWARVEVRNPA